jgi:hypothetical protein
MTGNAPKLEMLMHVDDSLNEIQRFDFIGRLRSCDAVEYACFTPGLDHLLLIDYDRDQ